MEDVVNEIIEVSKGISEAGLLVITAAFYLIVTATMMIIIMRWFVRLVNKIFDAQQTTLDSILELQKGQDVKINQVKEALTGEVFNQIRVVADYAFDYNKIQIVLTIAQVKEENNLDDRDRVEKKVKMILENFYNRRNSNFDAFTYNGKKLSYYANPEWTKKIYNFCIESIYDGRVYHRDYYIKNLDRFYEEVKVEFFNNLRRM